MLKTHSLGGEATAAIDMLAAMPPPGLGHVDRPAQDETQAVHGGAHLEMGSHVVVLGCGCVGAPSGHALGGDEAARGPADFGRHSARAGGPARAGALDGPQGDAAAVAVRIGRRSSQSDLGRHTALDGTRGWSSLQRPPLPPPAVWMPAQHMCGAPAGASPGVRSGRLDLLTPQGRIGTRDDVLQ